MCVGEQRCVNKSVVFFCPCGYVSVDSLPMPYRRRLTFKAESERNWKELAGLDSSLVCGSYSLVCICFRLHSLFAAPERFFYPLCTPLRSCRSSAWCLLSVSFLSAVSFAGCGQGPDGRGMDGTVFPTASTLGCGDDFRSSVQICRAEG